MTKYLHFFIRSHHDEFLPIGTFTDTSTVYKSITAPDGKVTPLTSLTLYTAIKNINHSLLNFETEISNLTKESEQISQYNNTPEDKLLLLRKISTEINNKKAEKQKFQRAYEYFQMLALMQQEAHDSYIKSLPYQEDDYIYYGLDCPEPKLKDIKKEVH